VYFSFVWFVYVAMCQPPPALFHTPMTRYSLYVPKVLLNTNKTNKQTPKANSFFLGPWVAFPTNFLKTV